MDVLDRGNSLQNSFGCIGLVYEHVGTLVHTRARADDKVRFIYHTTLVTM